MIAIQFWSDLRVAESVCTFAPLKVSYCNLSGGSGDIKTDDPSGVSCCRGTDSAADG